MPRPVIGVTGPDRGGTAAWWFTRIAVQMSGGIARRITPDRPLGVAGLDGLVIGGGADVSDRDRWPDGEPLEGRPPPAPPGQPKWRRIAGLVLAPPVYALRRAASRPPDNIDVARDDLERSLLDRAAALNLPVLGICRGAQIMNLFAGGSLHRELAGYYDEDPQPWTVLPRKSVRVEPGSRLAATLRTTACRVNGMHRHAVDRIGRGLRVVARERVGIAQALEHESRRFWIGVQWHPEYLPQQPEQRRLFDALVAAAAERRAVRDAVPQLAHAVR